MQRQEKTNVLSMNSPITATHCNTLQHTAKTGKDQRSVDEFAEKQTQRSLQHTATHCNTLHSCLVSFSAINLLQHTAKHCNTLHYTLHSYLRSFSDITDIYIAIFSYVRYEQQTCVKRVAVCCNVLQWLQHFILSEFIRITHPFSALCGKDMRYRVARTHRIP